MSDPSGATAGDASAQLLPKAKAKIGAGTGDTTAIHPGAPEPGSEQFKAAQKFLDEVSPGKGKTLGGYTGSSDNISVAVVPIAIPNSEPVKHTGIVSADAPPATPAPAAPLDHHDASFFKHDLLHDTERIGNVWGHSVTKYLKQGVVDAAKENVETGAWADKLVTGTMIGVAMRTFLPKRGVIRAVAGTVMAVNMAKDLVVPFYEGAKDAVASHDDKDLDNASRKVSKAVGNFVVDNAIGLPAAAMGEAGAGRALEKYAPGFESKKTVFFTSDKSTVGRFLNGTADKVDSYTARVSAAVKPVDPEVFARQSALKAVAELPAAEKAQMVEKAAQHSKAHFERAEFYRLGPKSDRAEEVLGKTLGVPDSEKPITLGAVKRITGEAVTGSDTPPAAPRVHIKDGRMSYSSYLDALENGVNLKTGAKALEVDIAASIERAQSLHGEPQGIVGPANPSDVTVKRPLVDVAISPDDLGRSDDGQLQGLTRNGRGKGGDSAKPKSDDATTARRKGKGKQDSDDTGTLEKTKPSGTKTESSPKDDLKHDVFAKVAAVAKDVQDLWTPEKIKLADARDQFEGPITATTELTKAPLPPEYKASTGQLKGLIAQLDNVKSLKDAGTFLMFHMKAANQLLFQQDNVRDLNMFTRELAGVFLTGMRKLGIPEDRLRRIIPSLVTETNDGGSGYFTNPPIDGIIDRPVTIVPRAFTRLISVMSDVIRHEALGHDHTYPELARFPEADRDNLIRGAVAKTMKEANIPEKMLKMGDENIKTSEFFFRLLKAEANENTSDFMGTASGGIGTPASLGVLLQSLRDGGLLETRNVFGKEFEDGIEPHGIDRWRIKFCAEVMRQLAPKDKTVNDYANALDQYAKEASRGGDNYTWASTDKPGEKIEIPMEHWDAIIPRIVKAQLDTPLDTLKDVNGNRHTLREMLGDQHAQIVKGIDELANQFVDAIRDGKTELPSFDKSKYTIGQVFSAGLVAWMRATRHDVDPAKSLDAIDKISGGLRAQYREFNPNEVPLTTPASTRLKQTLSQSPGQIMRITGAAVADAAPSLRTGTDRSAVAIGGSATADVIKARQWLYQEAHDMAEKTRELFGETKPSQQAPDSQPGQ